ncbi:unnamed protein product, partial [Gadus morhua 'NCC']
QQVAAGTTGKRRALGEQDKQRLSKEVCDTILGHANERFSFTSHLQQDVRARGGARGGARAEQSKVKAEGTCIYCGEAGHGKTPQWRARRAECPAYGKTCRKCNGQNHLDKACLGPVADDVEEGDLAWCAAGLESLQSVTWDRVREAISSSDDMRTLEEMAADSFPESRAWMPVAIRGFHQYRERRFLRKFYPVHSDRPPPRSIYDDLASRVAVPALAAAPRLPGLASGPVRPVTESGPAPPPAPPPAGSPRRGMQPTPIVPVVPAQGVLRAPPLGFVAPMAPLPPPPDVPPATDLRRSTRRAGVPAWHKDFAMG